MNGTIQSVTPLIVCGSFGFSKLPSSFRVVGVKNPENSGKRTERLSKGDDNSGRTDEKKITVF